MTTFAHPIPRRSKRGEGQKSPSLSSKHCTLAVSMPLQKGETFHSPSSPYSPSDPTLSVDNLPKRSLTSPKDLEALVLESQKRVEEIIKDFDQALSLSSDAVVQISQRDVLPVPSVFLAQTIVNANLQDVAEKWAQHQSHPKKEATLDRRQASHNHDSDSGIGSSISSGSVCDAQGMSSSSIIHLHPANNAHQCKDAKSSLLAASVYSRLHSSAPFSRASAPKPKRHVLDDYATEKIKKFIVTPLLKEEEFEEYHPLLEDVPRRIKSGKITCLRDLEKTLIFLAEVSTDLSVGEGPLAHCFLRLKFKAKSAASYLLFCNTAIQSIHTTVTHLNDVDLRRPTDRPYTSRYFVDLVEQVRQYARIMAVTRQKKAEGQNLSEMDFKEYVKRDRVESDMNKWLISVSSGEKLELRAKDGMPAEMVRVRADGTTVPIDVGHKQSTYESDDDDDETVIDAEVARSMARKRKCDIGKVEYRTCRECSAVFTRACDLTKHEKTHSRPWKCSDPDCRYHSEGWPTEKERDRHVNDKHSKDAALFKCLFEPCTYSSKRESNCKQHMEKAHGWEYVRAKSKKGEKQQKLVPAGSTKLVPNGKGAAGTSLPTPASSVAFPSLSSPSSIFSHSPAEISEQSFSPTSEHDSYDTGLVQMDSAMSGTDDAIFDESILRSNEMLEHDPIFANWHMSYSPQDVPELANTPGTGYSNSPANQSLPSNYEFDFTLDAPQWQNMPAHFPQWFTAPAASTSKTFNGFHAGEQQMVPDKWATTNQTDFTSYTGQQYNMNSYANYAPQQTSSTANTDFTLYGNDATMTHYDSTNLGGAMFPDLDLGLGDQFNAGNEESIYDDVDTERPMQSSEDMMMEQFMNFDGENHSQERTQ